MSKLKTWRVTVDMFNYDLGTTDRFIAIFQATTAGQCIMLVAFLFDNEKFDAEIVGTPVELKGAAQAALFTI